MGTQLDASELSSSASHVTIRQSFYASLVLVFLAPCTSHLSIRKPRSTRQNLL
ncbi:hypothetical protein M405DRAFT_828862 [Rhizopogon salebrosus TDB-379]|nr:hypothetical protein M405DRAFT_828862 [Rhizopogon salebrosus TDB-379]